MPGFLMHVGATVMCSHGGTAQPTTPYPRVTVGGQPVVCVPPPYVIAGCPWIVPIGVPLPCVTGQFTVGATRVTAGGQPLALSTAASVCMPNGTPLVVAATQTRVSAQ
jgi:hypothetical protein